MSSNKQSLERKLKTIKEKKKKDYKGETVVLGDAFKRNQKEHPICF